MAVRRMLPGTIILLLLVMGAHIDAGTPVAAAQSGVPCDSEGVPEDDLASAALGLTRHELDKLYGPGNAVQTGWLYEFDEFDLTLANCDLILTIDADGQFADPDAASGLVRTLLPEDAVLAGTWQFGTLQSAPQDADEWVSAESRGTVPAAGRAAHGIGARPLQLRRRCLQSWLHRPHRVAPG